MPGSVALRVQWFHGCSGRLCGGVWMQGLGWLPWCWLDRQGWITFLAALLLALITLFA